MIFSEPKNNRRIAPPPKLEHSIETIKVEPMNVEQIDEKFVAIEAHEE